MFDQKQAMDTVLNQMNIDEPSAHLERNTEMGDLAPRAVQKQEKQNQDKKDKREKKAKKEKKDKKHEKKARSAEDGTVETKKRKHIEVNGDVATEGKKKKKKKSAID